MADATKLPTLEYFQWSRPGASNPRLAAPIIETDTTLTFTNPPLDKDGKIISNAALIGVKNKAGYTETIYIPAGGVQGFGNVPDTTNLGTTATGVTRGINIAGIDFDTTAGLVAAHEQDSPVFCNVSAIHFEMMQSVMKGTIASGGENWQMGNEEDNDITVYAANGDTNKPFWRYDANQGTTGGWIYSNDGVSTQPFGDGSGLTGGDGITVTAGDIDIDVTDTVIFKNSSAGAGDANIVPLLDAAGRLDSTITGATYTEINQLSGTTNIAESDTFFGATDITGAQAETLSDGSNADSLHTHNEQTLRQKRRETYYTLRTSYPDASGSWVPVVTTSLDAINRSAAFTQYDSTGGTGRMNDTVELNSSTTVGLNSSSSSNEVEFFAKFSGGASGTFASIGLFTDDTEPDREIGGGNNSFARLFWDYDTSSLYLETGSSSSRTLSSALSGVTIDAWNSFRIVHDNGVDVKLYVNNVLKATNTTNLPNETLSYIAVGVNGGSFDVYRSEVDYTIPNADVNL